MGPASEVRAQVVKAVGRIEDVSMCDALERALADSAFWLRQNAAGALCRSQDRFARDAVAAELR